jgi:hypothetical protein
MHVKKKRLLRGLEQLGVVLERASEVLPPKTAPDARAPVSARDWEAAVGTRIAARALPAKLDRGVLHVRVASATWAQELSMLSEPIVAQLRARGVPVEALRFRVGTVEAPERSKTREEHVRTEPPRVPLPANVAGEVARVRDAELREAIRHAAEKNLGWQRMRSRASAVGFGAKDAAGDPKPQMLKQDATNERPEQRAAATPKPGARAPRFVGPETDQPDRAEGTVSASPRRTRGSV